MWAATATRARRAIQGYGDDIVVAAHVDVAVRVHDAVDGPPASAPVDDIARRQPGRALREEIVGLWRGPRERYHEPLPRPHRPGRIGQGDAGPDVHL